MEISIPILAALIVYMYNYGKITAIKTEIKIIKEMNEEKFWDKLDALGERLNALEIKVAQLHTRLSVYTVIAVFASSAVLKFVDKLF